MKDHTGKINESVSKRIMAAFHATRDAARGVGGVLNVPVPRPLDTYLNRIPKYQPSSTKKVIPTKKINLKRNGR